MIDPLKQSVAHVFRESLKERYTIKNIRRFPECAAMSDAVIAELRVFFLDQVYPAAEHRQAFESAFDSLGTVLRSPKKMFPLVGTAVTSFFRLGSGIPAALSAGKRALEAFLEMRRLEKLMVGCARSEKLENADLGDSRVFARLVACLPQATVFAFQKDLVLLFQSLANNRQLLSVAVAVLEDSRSVMRNRSDLYSAQEMTGLDLGLGLLNEGMALFTRLKPEDSSAIVSGIAIIERDWYDRQLKLAAG